MDEQRKNIVVIGAGIMGVSTAYNIITSIPGVNVSLVSEKFSPNTTSNIAIGHWRPVQISNTPEEKVKKWGQVTWDRLIKLVRSNIADQIGSVLVSGRELFRGEEPDPYWSTIVHGYRRLTKAELEQYPDCYISGYFYTTVVLNSAKYLPWLLAEFKARGGEVKQMKVEDFAELGEYDVIVNCAGMGARKLCNDSQLNPSRGHIIRAKAPWIKHFLVAPEDKIHILLNEDIVALGFTARADSDPVIKETDRKHILEGCAILEPSIANATEHVDYLGFRPNRDTVRLDMEIRNVRGRRVPIVHNYGHGGSGITLHWGCALDATNLVSDALHCKSNL